MSKVMDLFNLFGIPSRWGGGWGEENHYILRKIIFIPFYVSPLRGIPIWITIMSPLETFED